MLLLGTPSLAVADSGAVPRYLDVGVGAVALLLAIVMLVDVLALRRVASGAAIAEHVTHVLAAVACLATAVMMRWLVRFSPSADVRSLASLASDLLIIAAMAFFAIYFLLVRRAMVRFLKPLTAQEAIARAQLAEDALVAEHAGGPVPVDVPAEHHG